MADVVVTQIWQEPISAFLASQRQHRLARDLRKLEQAPLPAADLMRVSRLTDPRARLREMARMLNLRTHAGQPLGRIKIARLGVDFVFVQGTADANLTEGPGHYSRTALPGLQGTVGVAGHRTTYLAPFRHIDNLRHGDVIVLTMPYGVFDYRVSGKRVVAPSDDSVLRRRNGAQLALTACTPPFSATMRLVVTAQLVTAAPQRSLRPRSSQISRESPLRGLARR